MRAVYLRHVPFEDPGAFASALMKHGISIECHLFPKNGLPQDPGDLLIVMGGPMLVNVPRGPRSSGKWDVRCNEKAEGGPHSTVMDNVG